MIQAGVLRFQLVSAAHQANRTHIGLTGLTPCGPYAFYVSIEQVCALPGDSPRANRFESPARKPYPQHPQHPQHCRRCCAASDGGLFVAKPQTSVITVIYVK